MLVTFQNLGYFSHLTYQLGPTKLQTGNGEEGWLRSHVMVEKHFPVLFLNCFADVFFKWKLFPHRSTSQGSISSNRAPRELQLVINVMNLHHTKTQTKPTLSNQLSCVYILECHFIDRWIGTHRYRRIQISEINYLERQLF